ncbi:sensor histidine kinase [Nostocoides australiense]|nr:histidine kinase [Actinomycetota bacterium]MCB1300049.1 histidine kinase [Tetrasphaera sp.]HPF79760.1 histidine kinase [Tetrasphaera australiensis]HRW00667.1 histidine kinase [Tetrasphaera sp.]
MRGFDLPTAMVTVLIVFLIWLGIRLVVTVRGRSRGFLSDANRATYETLHTAARAARHLGSGLTPAGGAKAARHLRTLLDTPALSLIDQSGTVTWEGAHNHHAGAVAKLAEPVLRDGHTAVLDHGEVACTDVDCAIRAAVIAPIVCEGRVVGALAAYGPHANAGLARATAEVAGWLSAQVELAELSKERSRATEAELAALRAQISPHFIYNSLGAIASFVRTDPARARDLLLEFADFTRYALRKGGAFTTLADELRNVERYLVLEQARFGERLQVSLLIAPEVLSVTVPYLAIQPLVENAVRHGIANLEGAHTVSITAADRGAEAEIVVEDDGVGADPAHIQAVLDGTADTDSHGLGNVDARLRTIYGDERGLVVETAPGAGMRVSFRVPKFLPAAITAGDNRLAGS